MAFRKKLDNTELFKALKWIRIGTSQFAKNTPLKYSIEPLKKAFMALQIALNIKVKDVLNLLNCLVGDRWGWHLRDLYDAIKIVVNNCYKKRSIRVSEEFLGWSHCLLAEILMVNDHHDHAHDHYRKGLK
jgi:hypothetical protein